MTDGTREDKDQDMHSIPVEDDTRDSTENDQAGRGTDQAQKSDSGTESEDRRRWKQRLKNRREALTEIWDEDKRAAIIDEIQKLEKAGIREGFMSEDDRGSYEITPGNGSDSQVTEEDSTEQNDRTENETHEAADTESSGARRVETNREDSHETGDSNSSGGRPEKPDTPSSTSRSDTKPSTESDRESAKETSTDVEAVSPPAETTEDRDSVETRVDEATTEDESGVTDTAGESSSTTTNEDSEETPESATGKFAAATEDVDDGDNGGSGQSTVDEEPSGVVKPEGQAVSQEEFKALQGDLADLQETVNDLDQWFSEYKRRNEREHEEIRQYSIEEFAGNMLRVRDTLQRAIELNDWSESDKKAIQSVLKMFDQQFTSGAIDPISPKRGESFNSGRHEMVARKPAPELDKDSVVRVKKKGFLVSDRVIRPAQVVVAQPD
jgi:molecular chaperone GrpE